MVYVKMLEENLSRSDVELLYALYIVLRVFNRFRTLYKDRMKRRINISHLRGSGMGGHFFVSGASEESPARTYHGSHEPPIL